MGTGEFPIHSLVPIPLSKKTVGLCLGDEIPLVGEREGHLFRIEKKESVHPTFTPVDQSTGKPGSDEFGEQ
jgi:hypothetical protein